MIQSIKDSAWTDKIFDIVIINCFIPTKIAGDDLKYNSYNLRYKTLEGTFNSIPRYILYFSVIICVHIKRHQIQITWKLKNIFIIYTFSFKWKISSSMLRFFLSFLCTFDFCLTLFYLSCFNFIIRLFLHYNLLLVCQFISTNK